jgi:hypothetical protein
VEAFIWWAWDGENGFGNSMQASNPRQSFFLLYGWVVVHARSSAFFLLAWSQKMWAELYHVLHVV